MKNPEPFKFKVLSGLHKGADVTLVTGEYMIGSSDACDIILHDPSIMPEHMHLAFFGEGLTLSAKEGPITIDGEAVKKKEISLTAPQALLLGSVQITLGRTPDIGIQPVARHANHPEKIQTPKGDIDNRPPDNDDVVITSTSRPTSPPPSDPPAPSTKGNQPATKDASGSGRETPPSARKREKNRTFAFFISMSHAQKVILLSGLGVIVILMGIFLLTDRKSFDVEQKIKNDVQLIFKQLHQGQPYFSKQKNGQLNVQGYTRNLQDKIQLVNALKKSNLPILIKIYDDEKIMHACNHVLSALDFPLACQYKGQGNLVLKGFVTSRRDKEEVAYKLKENIPEIRNIDNRLWILNELIPGLNKILGELKLSAKIEFEAHPDYLLAKGSLRPKETTLWENAKEVIHNRYGNVLVLKEKFQTTKPGKIALPITGVTIGEVSYITLKGGRKFFEGGVLDNGYIIKSINKNRIVVTMNGREYHCDLTK